MPKKIFVFDIDQTLLSPKLRDERLNDVERSASSFEIYKGVLGQCQVLKKHQTAKIMQDILENGDEIAFVTSGSLSQEEMRRFCQQEYEINLRNFKHYNNIQDKTPVLKQIAGDKPYSDVVFVDNSSHHIDPARRAGFTTVYADNNTHDRTNGTEYIRQLETIVAEQTRARARARARAIESLQNIGIESNEIDGNFKLQDAVNNLAATGEFSLDDWAKIKDDQLLQTAVNNLAATGEFSLDGWNKITAKDPTEARNQFQDNGNWLFFKHTAERQKMKEASQALVMRG